ncbi:DUF2326 domain-containing protein [Pseudoalteromonas sp. SWYJ118]|uniref:DUF2326 domain-containing protein n=1 Tax=Pseudoalteromonas sp. SWYJ118 TaxID=2792062 RepID=UPI0018CF9DF2|nr:DUF2326 domain-containing protein [Pseudoalteromonas sp. SWYJ118]MBH0073990.1 DUF2326 domain-containing protein [Pseudoalteromonas sp. SWYJ118]
MKLIKLITKVGDKVIREIDFKDTLNIITNKKNITLSGNQIGKSVPGRILDYLLDGSISPIYIDEEFNTPEPSIERLFRDHVVTSSLIYIGLDGKTSKITRRLSTEKKLQLYYVNDENKKSKEYIEYVLKSMFNVTSAKPTIRKLAPKFLRTDSNRMTKTVKFNDDKFPISPSDRNTLFLYLFNFSDTEILSKIQKLKTSITGYNKKLTSFSGIIKEDKIIKNINETKRTLDKLEQSLLLTENNINKLEIIKKINEIDDEQNKLSDTVLALDFQVNNIIKTKKILEKEEKHHLLDELAEIYNYASIKMDSVLNDYSKVLAFHECLLSTKAEFVTEGLDTLEVKLLKSKNKINSLTLKKDKFYQELKSKKKIDEISDSVKQIGELNKKLIELTAIVDKKDSIQSRLDIDQEALKSLSEDLKGELANVDSFETQFKKNFKHYTNIFYGIEYNFSLNLNSENGDCEPSVDDSQSNNDGGLKRLEAITFDLSYIKSVSELSLKRPTYIVHDSIDEVDIKHIRQLFNESIKLNGQHIVSMLVSQLEESDYETYKDYIVLELSQEDKFFQV